MYQPYRGLLNKIPGELSFAGSLFLRPKSKHNDDGVGSIDGFVRYAMVAIWQISAVRADQEEYCSQLFLSRMASPDSKEACVRNIRSVRCFSAYCRVEE